MTSSDAAVQIRSLRVQLDVLEARLRTSRSEDGHTLADLRGMLHGDAQTSAEEIDAVKYRGALEVAQSVGSAGTPADHFFNRRVG